jgi:hypothetical protein
VGWSYITGHEIDAPEEYKTESVEMVKTNSYPANIALPEIFRKVRKKKDLLNLLT